MSQFSLAHIQTLSQTFYSHPIMFTKDQSVFFFCSLSVDTSSLREHNYQHRTITPFPVKMRQFPAPDSFHALTIPPGIMTHKELKPTSGFVIFLLLSVTEFRTSFYSIHHSIHLSIQHLLFLFNIYFSLITWNLKPVYQCTDHKSLKLFIFLSTIRSAVFFICLSVHPSYLSFHSSPFS